MDRINVEGFVFVREPEFKVLILKRTPERSGYFQPVCGGVEEGESNIAAVIREVREETGIEEIKSITDLNYSFTYKAEKNGVMMEMMDHCFAVEIREKCDIVLCDEHEDYLWCSKEEANIVLTWEPCLKALNKLIRIV